MKIIVTCTASFILFSQLLFGQSEIREDVIVGGHSVNKVPEANRSMLNCTPLYSFDTPDQTETGLASDNINLWVGGGYGSGFYKCNDSTGAVLQILPMPPSPTGYHQGGLAIGGNFLWYVYEQDGLLYKIDPANGAVINQFTLPNNSPSPNDPNTWGIAYDDGYLWEMEYNVSNGISYNNSYLYKLSYTAVPIDSFIIPHWILAISIINGELWGAATDVPNIYKISKSNGSFLDSIPCCVNLCYGLTQNSAGFWLAGNTTFNTDKVHRFGMLTGVEENSTINENDVELFPNPVQDILNVRNTFTGSDPITIYVYSMLGELVSDDGEFSPNSEISLNMGNLPPGVYQLRLISGNNTYSRKFVRM